MKRLLKLSVAFYFILFISNSVYAQANTDSINSSLTFELRNDTLFSNTGQTFFVGQKLIIGTAAGEDGYYRSIIYKTAAIVPSIWGQDMRYENAIENYVGKKKSREKVKSSLLPGNSLTIQKIRFCKIGKPYFYMISLSTDSDRFNCDIRLALTLKELLLSSTN